MIHEKLNIAKETKTLTERGLPENSFFHAIHKDGSEIKEHDTNWSDLSEEKIVTYGEKTKTVRTSKHPLKSLVVNHNGMTHEVHLKEGQEVYQAIKASASFKLNGETKHNILGRIIGLVENGEVIEEIFLNGETNKIEITQDGSTR